MGKINYKIGNSNFESLTELYAVQLNQEINKKNNICSGFFQGLNEFYKRNNGFNYVISDGSDSSDVRDAVANGLDKILSTDNMRIYAESNGLINIKLPNNRKNLIINNLLLRSYISPSAQVYLLMTRYDYSLTSYFSVKYKDLTTTSPSTSSTYSEAFVDSISQNANGKIVVTKKKLSAITDVKVENNNLIVDSTFSQTKTYPLLKFFKYKHTCNIVIKWQQKLAQGHGEFDTTQNTLNIKFTIINDKSDFYTLDSFITEFNDSTIKRHCILMHSTTGDISQSIIEGTEAIIEKRNYYPYITCFYKGNYQINQAYSRVFDPTAPDTTLIQNITIDPNDFIDEVDKVIDVS